MRDNNPIPKAHYNPRTRLYIIEYPTEHGKSVIPTPRWVKNEQTLRTWIEERINDKSLPEWFSNTTVE